MNLVSQNCNILEPVAVALRHLPLPLPLPLQPFLWASCSVSHLVDAPCRSPIQTDLPVKRP